VCRLRRTCRETQHKDRTDAVWWQDGQWRADCLRGRGSGWTWWMGEHEKISRHADWPPPAPPLSCAALAWACSQVWTGQAAPWPADPRQRTCRGCSTAVQLSTEHITKQNDYCLKQPAHAHVLQTTKHMCLHESMSHVFHSQSPT
jgi:hypothetical protein